MKTVSRTYPTSYENEDQMEKMSAVMRAVEHDLTDDECEQLTEQGQLNMVLKCDTAIGLVDGDFDELRNIILDIQEHGW